MKKSTIMKKLKLFLMAVIVMMSSAALNAQEVEVTFNADLTAFIESSDFDPEVDDVYITGTVVDPEWQEPGTNDETMMTDDDGDHIYTWTTTLDAESSYSYKYFYVPEEEESSWDYGEWEAGDDRMFETGTMDMTLDDLWGTYSRLVEFHVDMADFAEEGDFNPETDMVYISGEVLSTDWSEPGTNPSAQMTDGDGDQVYTWSNYLPADSSYAYKYFYVPEGEESSWDYGEWAGGSDRVAEIPDEDISIAEKWGHFKIHFVVTEDGETPLESADVTVGEETATTDAEGNAMLYALPDDSVTYTVSHADYADYVYGVQIDYADVEVLVDMTTASINEELAESFNMYPNPSTRVLNIDGLDNVNKIEVYNAVGQRVHVENNVSNSVQIATSGLKNGLYFVNFYNDRKVIATQKFLKK